MQSLTTIAHTAPPQPRMLDMPDFSRSNRAWNVHQERGVPEWAEQTRAIPERLTHLATTYPGVSLTWETDPTGADTAVKLPVLTIGAEGAPAALFVAGQHGREAAVPAATVNWVEQLLAARAAGDPQAAWLLQSRRIVVMPMANPRGLANAVDAIGHAHHEPPTNALNTWQYPEHDGPRTAAQRYFDQRRNQSTPDGGVDLNRNHATTWMSPEDQAALMNKWQKTNTKYTPEQLRRNDQYPGETPASEPETRIIDAVIRREQPTVVGDLHQFGNFIMSSSPAGTKLMTASLALEKIGRTTGLNWMDPGVTSDIVSDPKSERGTLNAHSVMSGADLGLTLELGRSFTPTPHDFTQIEQDLQHALTRLVRDADSPRVTSRGPDVSSSPRATAAGWIVGASDHAAGGVALIGAELVTDPLAPAGTGAPLTAADGAFDEPLEHVRIPADLGASSPVVGVRAQDADGNWGAITALALAK